MTVERRKYIRFLTQDNSFAKLKGGPWTPLYGQPELRVKL
jgi:hypothetical protein